MKLTTLALVIFGLLPSVGVLAQTPQTASSPKPSSAFLTIEMDQPVSESFVACPNLSSNIAFPAGLRDPNTGEYTPCYDDNNTDFATIYDTKLDLFSYIYVRMIAGNVESVNATFPTEDASIIEKGLKDKYGSPIDDTYESVQTTGGAELKRHIMTWTTPTFTILYQSIGQHIDSGYVSAATPVYIDKLKAEATKTADTLKNSF